ncbi:hypothetical protein DETS111669_23560 [Delftia tsuruhatensis]
MEAQPALPALRDGHRDGYGARALVAGRDLQSVVVDAVGHVLARAGRDLDGHLGAHVHGADVAGAGQEDPGRRGPAILVHQLDLHVLSCHQATVADGDAFGDRLFLLYPGFYVGGIGKQLGQGLHQPVVDGEAAPGRIPCLAGVGREHDGARLPGRCTAREADDHGHRGACGHIDWRTRLHADARRQAAAGLLCRNHGPAHAGGARARAGTRVDRDAGGKAARRGELVAGQVEAQPVDGEAPLLCGEGFFRVDDGDDVGAVVIGRGHEFVAVLAAVVGGDAYAPLEARDVQHHAQCCVGHGLSASS